MTSSVSDNRSPKRLYRGALTWVGIPSLVGLATIFAMGIAGFRVNFTPSEPLGLWRIVELDRELRIGDMVFICPPSTDAIRAARDRGYLRHGLCVDGVAPLIKSVVATSGQQVLVDYQVRIDGRSLPHSRVAIADGDGRELKPFEGGIVPPAAVYLHSQFPGSFDSRYFGPLPVDGVLGLAQEVWTYAP